MSIVGGERSTSRSVTLRLAWAPSMSSTLTWRVPRPSPSSGPVTLNVAPVPLRSLWIGLRKSTSADERPTSSLTSMEISPSGPSGGQSGMSIDSTLGALTGSGGGVGSLLTLGGLSWSSSKSDHGMQPLVSASGTSRRAEKTRAITATPPG